MLYKGHKFLKNLADQIYNPKLYWIPGFLVPRCIIEHLLLFIFNCQVSDHNLRLVRLDARELGLPSSIRE